MAGVNGSWQRRGPPSKKGPPCCYRAGRSGMLMVQAPLAGSSRIRRICIDTRDDEIGKDRVRVLVGDWLGRALLSPNSKLAKIYGPGGRDAEFGTDTRRLEAQKWFAGRRVAASSRAATDKKIYGGPENVVPLFRGRPVDADMVRDVTLPCEKDAGAGDRDLTDMNERYAVVRIGGKTRVSSFEESPVDPRWRVPVFSSVQDFCSFHLKRKKTIIDSKGNEKEIGVGRWWINHKERRQYEAVVYAPGGAGVDVLNLWTGFGCEPREGSYDLYRKHLRDNICSGVDSHFEYLFNWMAKAVQQPGRMGETAVVMRGREGTGKGVAIKQYGGLFGSHFRHVFHAKHLVGNFNAHLQACSLLYADEAFFAGDRQHESVLKGLITEETIQIEPKGIDSFAVRNCTHVMMSSNADWVIPAGANARRFFVLDVADTSMHDSSYFAAIVEQMDGGGREALLFDLMHRDLSEFNVRLVPQTDALVEQKAYSRRGIDRLIEHVAYEGRLPSAHALHPNIAVTTGEEREEGFYFQAKSLVPELRHMSSVAIARRLVGTEKKERWGCSSWKDSRRRGIAFPPLAELRQLFDREHGPQEWPEAGPVDWEYTENSAG